MNLADNTTPYAQNVWLADMAYYRANYWQGHAEVKYTFPLTIKKTESQWYVKAYGDYLGTNNHLNQKIAGLSIGIYN